jgi:hypothetical protein
MERLTFAHLVTFAALTSQGIVLLFITALIEPLIFAHVNGYQVLGAELPLSSARSMPMRLLERWAELAFTTEAARHEEEALAHLSRIVYLVRV